MLLSLGAWCGAGERLGDLLRGRFYRPDRPASRPYHGLPDIEYPLHDRDALVTACGRICMHRKKINISTEDHEQAGRQAEIRSGVDRVRWVEGLIR